MFSGEQIHNNKSKKTEYENESKNEHKKMFREGKKKDKKVV